MSDYIEMYKKVFNAATEAIEILQKAQKDAEEIFIKAAGEETPLILITGEMPKQETGDR